MTRAGSQGRMARPPTGLPAMPKLKFRPETPLYTSDDRAWRPDQLPEVLDALQSIGRPLVLFVHGRGGEPRKSLQGGTFTRGLAVHKVELGYDVRVLMFNWDSDFPFGNLRDRERPLSHTDAAARSLGQVLQGLQAWQAAHPAAPRPALLVHSMGSIVVQKAVQNGHWPVQGPLFSSVLLSQPDADDVGHAAWLEPLARRERVFVSFNRDDGVLLKSTDARPEGAHALGLGTEQPLASHATYVDLTHMGRLGEKDDDHEVFGKGAMNGQIHVCRFFTQVLTGQAVVLDEADNVESIDRGVVMRLRSRNEPGAPCLKRPILPDGKP